MLVEAVKPLCECLKYAADKVPDPAVGVGLFSLVKLIETFLERNDSEAVVAALSGIEAQGGTVLRLLKEQRDLFREQGDPGTIEKGFVDLAEYFYLRHLADQHLYLDFKGIDNHGRQVTLKLDDVFVPLRTSRRKDFSLPPGLHGEKEQNLSDDIASSPVSSPVDEVGKGFERQRGFDAPAGHRSVGSVLANRGGVVLLGNPGCGKSTQLKQLARVAALGPEAMKERYPELPKELFPVLIPLTSFGDPPAGTERHDDLLKFIETALRRLGGEPLIQAFNFHWGMGRCLILLDGLDEIAQRDHRIRTSRAVDQLFQRLQDNRAAASSRLVGYEQCRPNVPCDEVVLEPFTPADISTFCKNWYRAVALANKPESPDLQDADAKAHELLKEIDSNSGVKGLATNPLMLTIIAFIKHQKVRLPERRVELYRAALETLVETWNRARSLAGIPLGEDNPSFTETVKVWSHVAFWMHESISRGTLRREKLHEKLVEILVDKFDHDELEATKIADSYLKGAADSCGLLEERGADQFAFMHQTFQEYLAAHHLAVPTRHFRDKAPRYIHRSRWQETIRLAAGIAGVQQQDDEALADLLTVLLEHDERDPLGPYVAIGTRLAAACHADEVGFRKRDQQRILNHLLLKMASTTSQNSRYSLFEFLQNFTGVASSEAIPAIRMLAECVNWIGRWVAARFAVDHGPDATILDLLAKLSDDKDEDVSGMAHFGLWRANLSETTHLKLAMQKARISAYSPFTAFGQQNSVADTLRSLLTDKSESIRLAAVRILGEWGHRDQALPTLHSLLKSRSVATRIQAARTISHWGHFDNVSPLLLSFLKDKNDSTRSQAAHIVSQWGQREETLAPLLALLKDKNHSICLQVSSMISQWEQREQALPLLLSLLKEENANARLQAADILCQWGQREQALPSLLSLITNDNVNIRLQAAGILSESGRQDAALPVLLSLLTEKNAYTRLQAASILGRCEHQEPALAPLRALLKHKKADFRLQSANILLEWGHHDEALPVLISLLDSNNPGASRHAQVIMSSWGPFESASKAILKHIGYPDDKNEFSNWLQASHPKSAQAEQRSAFLESGCTPTVTDKLVHIFQWKAAHPSASTTAVEILHDWCWDILQPA